MIMCSGWGFICFLVDVRFVDGFYYNVSAVLCLRKILFVHCIVLTVCCLSSTLLLQHIVCEVHCLNSTKLVHYMHCLCISIFMIYIEGLLHSLYNVMYMCRMFHVLFDCTKFGDKCNYQYIGPAKGNPKGKV